MIYCFDLDNTICATPAYKLYSESIPHPKVIKYINGLKLKI